MFIYSKVMLFVRLSTFLCGNTFILAFYKKWYYNEKEIIYKVFLKRITVVLCRNVWKKTKKNERSIRSMDKKEILQRVDHTQLKAYATWEDIVKLCDEAIAGQTASVCVPPTYIKRIHDTYGDKINICTVVGFPLGYSVTEAKVAETKQAVIDGAHEIDMVINISHVKNGMYDEVEQEIRALKEACGGHILKVIIETCYLTEDEKIAMCKAVTRAGADYIKTSTGFGTGGATIEDVRLFKEHIGDGVKIKAAGGISTLEDLEAFVAEGCDRIGTSRAVGLLQD